MAKPQEQRIRVFKQWAAHQLLPAGSPAPRSRKRNCGPVIYLLVDPRDRTVRYAGVTTDLARRLAEHLQASQTNPRMRQWIGELGALGLKPELLPVEWPGKNWQRAERAWIAWLRSHGGDTYNIAAGGLPWWKAPNPRASAGAAPSRLRRSQEVRQHCEAQPLSGNGQSASAARRNRAYLTFGQTPQLHRPENRHL
jgi:hypothetical protein